MNFPLRKENNQTSLTSYTNISTSPQYTEATKKSPLDIAAEQIINADLKRQMKLKAPKGRGKGRGRGGSVNQPSDSSQNKLLKKAIPNAVVHNARDIQLKEILNQVTNQNQTNISTNKHILINQLQGLLSSHSKPDLNEISQALSIMQNKQPTVTSSTFSETKPMSIVTNKNNESFSKEDNVIMNSGLPKLPSTSSTSNPQSDLQTLSQNTIVTNNTTANQQQQMLLLQLVSQNQSVTSNTSIIPSNAQAFVSTMPQPQKILINTTQQSSPTALLQQQTSPVGVPVQYVVRPSPTLTIHQPIVQYVAPYVDSNSKGASTTSYVKIAPAVVQNNLVEKVNPLIEEQQKQEKAMLESMQEHLSGKNLNTQKVYETLPAAGEFLSTIASQQHFDEDVKNDEKVISKSIFPLL